MFNSVKQCLGPNSVSDGDLIQMWQVAKDTKVMPVEIMARIDAESDIVC